MLSWWGYVRFLATDIDALRSAVSPVQVALLTTCSAVAATVVSAVHARVRDTAGDLTKDSDIDVEARVEALARLQVLHTFVAVVLVALGLAGGFALQIAFWMGHGRLAAIGAAGTVVFASVLLAHTLGEGGPRGRRVEAVLADERRDRVRRAEAVWSDYRRTRVWAEPMLWAEPVLLAGGGWLAIIAGSGLLDGRGAGLSVGFALWSAVAVLCWVTISYAACTAFMALGVVGGHPLLVLGYLLALLGQAPLALAATVATVPGPTTWSHVHAIHHVLVTITLAQVVCAVWSVRRTLQGRRCAVVAALTAVWLHRWVTHAERTRERPQRPLVRRYRELAGIQLADISEPRQSEGGADHG